MERECMKYLDGKSRIKVPKKSSKQENDNCYFKHYFLRDFSDAVIVFLRTNHSKMFIYCRGRYNGKERRQMYDINLSLNHVFKTDFFLRSLNFMLPRKKQNS